MSPRPPRRRLSVLLQVSQTLLVLGAAILVVGLLLQGGRSAVALGAVLLVGGAVLLGVGLVRNRRGRSG